MNTPCWEAGGWTALVDGNRPSGSGDRESTTWPAKQLGSWREDVGSASDQGKAATVAARKCGQRPSFKTPRYRGKAKVDLQNQFIGAACCVKRWLRLLAQQSS